MGYNSQLADRVRQYLQRFPDLHVQEKNMFGGLAFMVNGKMCVNISNNRLMCRFDPAIEEELSRQQGYEPMLMRGKVYRGYCYVVQEVLRTSKDLTYWVDQCIAFNSKAQISKKSFGKEKGNTGTGRNA